MQATSRNEEGQHPSSRSLRLMLSNSCKGMDTVGQLLAEQVEKADVVQGSLAARFRSNVAKAHEQDRPGQR